jgi:hypothetical protein
MHSFRPVWDKEQVPSLRGREGACNGIKEVRDPMQGIFSVSASNEDKDFTDSHSAGQGTSSFLGREGGSL